MIIHLPIPFVQPSCIPQKVWAIVPKSGSAATATNRSSPKRSICRADYPRWFRPSMETDFRKLSRWGRLLRRLHHEKAENPTFESQRSVGHSADGWRGETAAKSTADVEEESVAIRTHRTKWRRPHSDAALGVGVGDEAGGCRPRRLGWLWRILWHNPAEQTRFDLDSSYRTGKSELRTCDIWSVIMVVSAEEGLLHCPLTLNL